MKKNEMKENDKILVLFPGRNYSTDAPLLYYAKKIYEKNGYEILPLVYENPPKDSPLSIPERIAFTKENVMKILEQTDWSSYQDIVFVSKSMGTVLAGEAAEKLSIPARHIYLTPLKQTLAYMTEGANCVTFAGTNDSHLGARELSLHCKKNHIPCRQYKGVGHSLEAADSRKTLQILSDIMHFYERSAGFGGQPRLGR